ncbi:MAG: WPE palindromic element domain-containing protein [Wolbachia sp.]
MNVIASFASNTRVSSQCVTLGSSKLCLQMCLTNIRLLALSHAIPVWDSEESIATKQLYKKNWIPVSATCMTPFVVQTTYKLQPKVSGFWILFGGPVNA